PCTTCSTSTGCPPSPTRNAAPSLPEPGGRARAAAPATPARSARLEGVGVQVVAWQELVEVGAIALGEPRRLAHVAHRDLQDLRQVIAGELVARLAERRQLARAFPERALHELAADDGRARQRDVLAHDVVELADVARPLRADQELDRLRRVHLALLPRFLGDFLQEV